MSTSADVLTAATLRRLVAQIESHAMPVPFSGSWSVTMSPRALPWVWEIDKARALKMWWSMRPWIAFWSGDIEEQTNRVLFWMECRPWR